jgi:GMP synthase-like glutamine amidotransferase
MRVALVNGPRRPPSPMANCLIIQHVAPESAFALEDALVRAGVHVDTRRVFAGDPVPAEVAGWDGLVVMGGPVSAASDEGFPSRPTELALLADALRAGVPTLGVCLGAQLLALAGGGPVYSGERGPEIGWSPVSLVAARHDDPLLAGLPDELTVLQWHGDTFGLPPGGQLLASSERYPNQAFRLGDAAWGLQFHLEVTAAAVEGFAAAFGADAEGLPGGLDAIRSATPDALGVLARWRDIVGDRFAALVAARVTTADLVDLG